MNTHNNVKQETICSVCGAIYSEVITEDCPVCKLREDLNGDSIIQSYLETLKP